jgi:hypothetical protein
MSDAQRNLLGQQSDALQSGYTEALRVALNELPYLTQAGQQQAQAAKLQQDLGLIGTGALTKAGAERQKYEQSLLDFPLANAVTASGLMRGYQIPTTQTSTKVGPGTQGQYQQSDLQNILGVLSLIGATQGGTTGAAGNALGVGTKFIFDKLKALFSGLGGARYTVDPTEFTGGLNAEGVPVYFDKETGTYYDNNGQAVDVTFEY